MLKITNIQDEKISLNKVVYICPDDYDKDLSSYIVQKGDILIAMSGATTGKIAINQHDKDFYLNQRVGKFIPDEGILTKYLFNFLSTKIEENLSISAGAAQPNLSTEQIKNITIPVPPLSEQERIVGVLDCADKLVRDCRQALETAEKLPLALFIKTFGDPNQNPNGYPLKKLGDICDVIGGGTPKTTNKEYFDGEISWLTPKDLSCYNHMYISKGARNITELGLDKSSAVLMPKGTVLISSRAPIGYVAIAENDICTNQGFKSLVIKSELTPEFVYYWVKCNTDYLNSLGTGATFKEISGKTIKNLQIPIPTKAQQQTFLQQVQIMETMIADRRAALAKAQDLFQSLLHNAMAGRL